MVIEPLLLPLLLLLLLPTKGHAAADQQRAGGDDWQAQHTRKRATVAGLGAVYLD